MTWDDVWPPRWDQLLSDLQAGASWPLIVGAAGVGLMLIFLVLYVARALRSKTFDAKANIGFAVVQTGVAFITITGGYEFFRRLLAMPAFEAGLLAAFIEACVWAAVGHIYSHGRGEDRDGNPNIGFGPAGGFFWTTIGGGGLLAILGSESLPVAVGRIVVVVLGAYMWYLRLLRATRPSGKPTRLRWTPKAFLLLVGAIVPGDDDVRDEAREWQVRKMARAIRWANSGRWPWAWLGGRTLVQSAEQAQEDVIAEARRRYAAAHLLRTQIAPDSPVMAALLTTLQREALGEPAQITAETPFDDVQARLAAVERHLPTLDGGPGPTPSGSLPAKRDTVLAAAGIPSARRASSTAVPETGPERGDKPDSSGRRPTRQAAPVVPTRAISYAQWLAIWVDMQQAPQDTTNAEFAERHDVGERTITNIRRAGREGLLTEDQLQRLRSAEPAEPAVTTEATTPELVTPATNLRQMPASPAAPVAPAATDRSRRRGKHDTVQRDREEVLAR